MQVEPTQGLDPLGLPPEARGLPQANQVPAEAEVRGDALGGTPDAAFQSYVDQAAQAEEVRREAVEEARRLLANGELDTDEAARRAAESILTLGI